MKYWNYSIHYPKQILNTRLSKTIDYTLEKIVDSNESNY